MSIAPSHPPRLLYEPLLRHALEEDIGFGDLTTDTLVPERATAEALFVARSPGRVAGLRVAIDTLRLLDSSLESEEIVVEGNDVQAGTCLARVRGNARALLTGERTALDFVCHLSGIATATREAVAQSAGTDARIVDTRKTTPGLRLLEKYAVRAGGAHNHRFRLDDAILIKDNHLVVAGSIAEAVARAREAAGHTTVVEVEVDGLEQLDEALEAHADVVLLDNFNHDELREAVRRTANRAVLEASGGIRPRDVAAVAATGVDIISLGWLTHSAPALDIGLDVSVEPGTTP
jgi:nicotinate-nucleotide pyrophosphorylase (carboxylating)